MFHMGSTFIPSLGSRTFHPCPLEVFQPFLSSFLLSSLLSPLPSPDPFPFVAYNVHTLPSHYFDLAPSALTHSSSITHTTLITIYPFSLAYTSNTGPLSLSLSDLLPLHTFSTDKKVPLLGTVAHFSLPTLGTPTKSPRCPALLTAPLPPSLV